LLAFEQAVMAILEWKFDEQDLEQPNCDSFKKLEPRISESSRKNRLMSKHVQESLQRIRQHFVMLFFSVGCEDDTKAVADHIVPAFRKAKE